MTLDELKVGQTGIIQSIQGDGPLRVGKGPVRTGVTAILPRGHKQHSGVFGGYAVGNGNGEMTGTIPALCAASM